MEKGVLQLLFDLRFLHDLLSHGRPAAAFTRLEEGRPQLEAEAKAQGDAFVALETDLQVGMAQTSPVIGTY